jgi:hypothetical protein
VPTLGEYRSNVHSQNGEDGVLEEIFRRLGVDDGFFVEFGAWDGKHLSNTFRLAEEGWSGLYVEGDDERFAELEHNVAAFDGRVAARKAWIAATGDSSLDAVLEREHVPAELELLSIDIDSDDWNVLLHLERFRPLVVVVEINSGIPPGIVQTHRGPEVQGSSFSATVLLGEAKGYTVVCHTGNVILVRDDRVAELELPPEELAFPELLFDYNGIVRAQRGAAAPPPAGIRTLVRQRLNRP